MKLKILNSRDVKKIKEIIEAQFGCNPKLDYVFLQSSKDKIYLIDKQCFDVDHKKLRVNSMGMYFAEIYNEGLRLTIEGSQIIGPYAKKGIVEISKEQEHEWLKGFDLEIKGYNPKFVIVKHENDFLGCAKHKHDNLLNHTPKARRLMVSD